MSKKDLFAPLSEKEKELLFKPLSKEEKESLMPQETGSLKAAGLGAVQGATFGFADEAEAKLRSLIEDPSYEELLKDIRERYSKAEMEAPVSYTAGQVGGGLLTSIVPVVGATGVGGTLGRMVLGGAVGGAATSLGTTEKDKLSAQALSDAATGAGVGAGVGVALGSAAPWIAKGIKGKVAASEVGEDVADVFNKIRSNEVATFGREAQGDFAKKIRSIAEEDILGGLKSTQKHLSKSYDDIKRISKKEDVPVNVADLVKKIREKAPGIQQGVSEKELLPLQTNLSAILDEKEVVKQVAKEIDPAVSAQTAMDKLTKMVATGDLKAERDFARKYIKNQISKELAKEGLDGKELAKAVDDNMQGITNELIDETVEKIRSLGLRQPAELPKEAIIDPVTGIPVAMAKRVDADIAVPIPLTKLEKVSETVAGRTLLPKTELVDYTNNIKSLLTDKLKQDNPVLYSYILGAKKELEGLIKENTSSSLNLAKELIDKKYGELIQATSKNLKIDPTKFSTSRQGQKTFGKAVDDVSRMIKNYEDPTTTERLNLDEFINSLTKLKVDQLDFGQSPDALKKKISDASRNMVLSERATGTTGLQGGATGLKGLYNLMQESVRAKTLSGAELAGNVAKSYDKGMKWISDVTPEGLTQMANKMGDNTVSKTLRKIATQPEAKRKAMLFALMQQPAYRETINSTIENEE